VKRPERIRVLGKRYRFEWKDKILDEKGRPLNGQADCDGLLIEILNSLPLDTEQDIVLHEVLHVVEGQMGLNVEDTVIERLATGMLSVLKDNPALVAYLRKK
jgi:hypothetical protein